MNTYKLIQGDCLDVLPGIENNSIDLIVTDPPYYLPINSYVGTRVNGYQKRSLADTSILRGFFDRIFKEFDRLIKKNGTFYIFCDAQSYPIFYNSIYPYCNHVRLIIWDKIISYNGYTWRHQHELILWGEKEDTERIPTGEGDIIKYRGVLQEDRLHPAEKPVGLIKILIKKHKEAQNILDPFSGSGSTMYASQDLGRNCTSIEIDKDYCDVIKKRCWGRQFLDREVKYEEVSA